MKKSRFCILLVGLWGCEEVQEAPEGYERLRINEFMASNSWTIQDDVGGYSDWIELYNPTSEDLSLEHFFLTDDFETTDLHEIGDVTIPAKGFVLFWADEDPELGANFLNFKLSKEGGVIGLYDKRRKPIDLLEYEAQGTDYSAARSEDGGEEWTIVGQPTPGESNE
jgi:hypothetical protein